MVRLARYEAEDFVDAAVALIAEGGGAAASMAAIARKVGAPTGSIYHRFESRAAIIATAWQAMQRAFVDRVAPHLAAGRARDAAFALLAWARDDIARARVFLLNDLEALLDGAPPRTLRRTIVAQREELDQAFQSYVDRRARMTTQPRDEVAARARFLVFDGPIALLRPHLLAGGQPPAFVERIVDEMHADESGTGAAPAPARGAA